jgi:hypothetical protein
MRHSFVSLAGSRERLTPTLIREFRVEGIQNVIIDETMTPPSERQRSAFLSGTLTKIEIYIKSSK